MNATTREELTSGPLKEQGGSLRISRPVSAFTPYKVLERDQAALCYSRLISVMVGWKSTTFFAVWKSSLQFDEDVADCPIPIWEGDSSILCYQCFRNLFYALITHMRDIRKTLDCCNESTFQDIGRSESLRRKMQLQHRGGNFCGLARSISWAQLVSCCATKMQLSK